LTAECTCERLEFHGLGQRVEGAGFNGSAISSDGGVLLFREVEARTGLLAGPGWRRGEQLNDDRDPEQTEHSVSALVSQRIIAAALGYEDFNDHDRLRPFS
jgi:hypothetical protein